jgi:L-lactate permease
LLIVLHRPMGCIYIYTYIIRIESYIRMYVCMYVYIYIHVCMYNMHISLISRRDVTGMMVSS